MNGEVVFKNNTVPFSMIKTGKCFLLNQKACMKILKNGITTNAFVFLDTGIVDSANSETRVIPLDGRYTLVETTLEEEEEDV